MKNSIHKCKKKNLNMCIRMKLGVFLDVGQFVICEIVMMDLMFFFCFNQLKIISCSDSGFGKPHFRNISYFVLDILKVSNIFLDRGLERNLSSNILI